MDFIKFDENNNLLKISDSKIDETYLEIGKDIIWKVDVKRNNQIITISPSEMTENEEVVRFYDNFSQLKVCEENGIKTIRFKTNEELKQEKYMSLVIKYLNDPNIKAIVQATMTQLLQSNIPGIDQSNTMFTNQECLDWQNWYNGLAKNQKDLSNYTLEEINELILEIPIIPEAFASRFL